MLVLLKCELTKLLKRRDIYIILTLGAIVPLTMAILIATGSGAVSFTGQYTPALYPIGVWSLFRMLLITYVIPVYISSTLLASEIESGSINLLLFRARRIEILNSKAIAAQILLTVFYGIFIAFSFLSYYLFLSNTEFSVPFAESIVPFRPQMVSLFLFYVELTLVSVISFTVSTFVKGYLSLLTSLGIIIVSKILENIKSLIDYLPTYICDVSRLSTTSDADALSVGLASTGLLLLYILVFYFIAVSIFRRIDIKS